MAESRTVTYVIRDANNEPLTGVEVKAVLYGGAKPRAADTVHPTAVASTSDGSGAGSLVLAAPDTIGNSFLWLFYIDGELVGQCVPVPSGTGSLSLEDVLAADLGADYDVVAELIADVAGVTDHTELDNIGTNTHAQIDAHIADTSNPHSVTAAQLGALTSVAAADITDATADGIALMTSADANAFTDADEAKLDGIEAGATADQTAAEILAAFEAESGRDVSADGTKLDGIEAGATADQTGAEIKAAYEAEADTNAFDDAAVTKLAGIEAGADVTDATNVAAAGALMADGSVTGATGQAQAFSNGITATAASASDVGAIINLAAVQTANGIELKLSDGTVVAGFDERGALFSDLGTDNSNFFAGNDAGNADASSADNIGIGNGALDALTSGAGNVAVGSGALGSLTSGSFNFGLGDDAGGLATDASHSIWIGRLAGGGSNSSFTVAIGSSAGRRTSGNNNVIVGYASGNGIAGTFGKSVIIGTQAAQSLTDGDEQAILGYSAGQDLTTGANNTLLGFQTGKDLVTGSGNVIIGYNVRAPATDTSNRLLIGNNNTLALLDGTMATTSAASSLTINGDVTLAGSEIAAVGDSSTTSGTAMARLAWSWNDSTHATRSADATLYATDYGAEREGLRVRATGAAAAIGFLGATPAARQAHIADVSSGTDTAYETAINSILAILETFGLTATS